jgi:hypothetical protein
MNEVIHTMAMRRNMYAAQYGINNTTCMSNELHNIIVNENEPLQKRLHCLDIITCQMGTYDEDGPNTEVHLAEYVRNNVGIVA